MSTIVTAADAAHFLALVPRLLGFTPTESLVVVPLARGRSLGAMRVDLPPDCAHLDATASTVVGLLCRVGGADSFAAVVFTDAPATNPLPGADLAEALERSADACGLGVVDVLTVAGTGWGSHFDGQLPPGGRPLDEIRRRLPPPTGDQNDGADLPPVEAAAVAGVDAAVASLEAALTVLCGIPAAGAGAARIDPAALEAACALDDLPALYEDALTWDAASLDPMHVAVLSWCLARPSLRDVGIVQWASDRSGGDTALDAQRRWEDGEEYPADLASVMWGEGPRPDPRRLERALELVRHVAARTPERHRAGALATAGWLAWSLGRSTHADRHAAEALDLDPTHGLAEIVRSFVAAAHLPDWAFRR
ncbi:DUF4192 domain-containing protein [Microbacterium sp. EYE_5]|uniref:DUF4192 family protein n=1 Tax=unclassified Microbacterium TaxID=2609290 RepID=UPI002003B290|nr:MULTISPECIES: DUF4192 family protein [unclassified Microbacterium]MCK6079786.1 DUF4192 domain-containing protein [Microbacterium sp. EYE_382]MCK6085057.1 DUF4192 domain-containing protein [Microbacterium sp. EYE_384]MCK6122717.1 DUF4192 domain-containing protein [Microbacterium sp. EYE_80]MCK6125820.1 DUF4192 domain-containing protein [Microbacterium sp. EYE_79]MCK6140741.1 DUF4192 domain-containing protein [Microbacterium sp. EYE_39]